ncbi:MAG: hypothetical protein GXO65_07655 [Euryarchaeota archaeon]|nr:hypothetical protein [Euryarchaeota archaeon]
MAQLSGYKREGEALLAITDEDLFVPGLNFIFGISKIGGGIAILSLRRLREAAGRPLSRQRYEERVRKEVLHEVGHAAGLTHCKDDCVMKFSNSIYEVDEKNEDMCDRHKSQFLQYLNP